MRKIIIAMLLATVLASAISKKENNRRFCMYEPPIGSTFKYPWFGSKDLAVKKRMDECYFVHGKDVSTAQMETNLKVLLKMSIKYGTFYSTGELVAQRIGIRARIAGISTMIIINAHPVSVISIHPSVKKVPNHMTQLSLHDTEIIRKALKKKKW